MNRRCCLPTAPSSDNLDNAPARSRLETDVSMAMLALGYRFGTDRVGEELDEAVASAQRTQILESQAEEDT